jgi:hypothetical protein
LRFPAPPVNWGRQWGRGAYENAELRNLEFEVFPLKEDVDSKDSKLALSGPMRLLSKPVFLDYGFIIDPGTYALTGFKVKVAKSVRDVGYFEGSRQNLIKDGAPVSGTFNVNAGEIVYIGHFFLDCHNQPMPWRYYPDGRQAFSEYLDKIVKNFTFLNKESVKFRLFKTSTMGVDYELK